MPKGEEQKLQTLCRNYFSQTAKTYGVKLEEGVKVLHDIICLSDTGSFKFEFAFAHVDLAFYLPVDIDASHWKPDSIFTCVSLAERDRNVLNIPFLIFELKRGGSDLGGVTVDAVRSRSILARSIKHLFPFCSYIFLADSTNKRPETVMRHGRDFTHYFLHRAAITPEHPEFLAQIDTDFVRPHLQNLKHKKTIP
jgi:hypothetical protein